MRNEALTIGAVALLTVAVVAALVVGQFTLGAVIFVTLGVVITARVAGFMANDLDRSWITTLLPLAFGAKMLGTFARYVMVTIIYGRGDSFGYYRSAIQLVHDWRRFVIPQGIHGGAGTRFVEVFTSFVFLPTIPSFIVGFMMFAALSFIGTILFYLAFRRWAHEERVLFIYALFLFFLPSLLFWPSAIGKDAIMVFSLGIAAYGASRLLEGQYVRGGLIMLPGLLLAAGVRAHVAALLAASAVLAVGLAQSVGHRTGWFARLLIIGVAVVGLVFLASTAAKNLKLDPGSEGLDQFLQETQRRTGQGGSAVVGHPVQSPADFPEATLRVLFRPLPYEASSPAALIGAVESLIMLGILVIRFPAILHNVKRIRSQPYLLFALVYTMGFIVAFSAIFNLGILARQRTQVLPLFLAVVVGLGFRHTWMETRDADTRQVASVG